MYPVPAAKENSEKHCTGSGRSYVATIREKPYSLVGAGFSPRVPAKAGTHMSSVNAGETPALPEKIINGIEADGGMIVLRK
jgi:hypothetical protein